MSPSCAGAVRVLLLWHRRHRVHFLHCQRLVQNVVILCDTLAFKACAVALPLLGLLCKWCAAPFRVCVERKGTNNTDTCMASLMRAALLHLRALRRKKTKASVECRSLMGSSKCSPAAGGLEASLKNIRPACCNFHFGDPKWHYGTEDVE